MADPIYLDNHATTRVDPRVLEAMLPYFTEIYGNAASTSHGFGHEAKEAVDNARAEIAAGIGGKPREIVFTSGATESNNLAIRGVCERQNRRGNHLVTVRTEHRAVLDPIERLGRRGFEVTLLEVEQAGSSRAGRLDPDQLRQALRDDTLLVSVMLANNEIGILQPIAEIAEICHQRGALLHCDATQAVGRIPVDVLALGVDLMSFTAHKIYGPKGVGALWVRRSSPAVRLEPQIAGGGHEGGFRSGTLNVPGIVGFAKALALCIEEMPREQPRLAELRDRLFAGLTSELDGVSLNGPSLEQDGLRLAGNLNVSFEYVDGEALLMNMQDVAVSSGSACTSANPEPSHVLRALGLADEAVRSSLRFGLGRFNTDEDVSVAIASVAEVVRRLRKLSSMA
ncbi:MAG: aminotransferase class V-fold PLP-dependent enzyme [Planctomycetota bacterium]|nr:MAG: aminotransferase class V-fold PLP-dependent enzyme [Planctomycetota bacterium]